MRTPRKPGPVARPIAERFWEKVDRSDGPDACWPWTGKTNGGGYGLFTTTRDGVTRGRGAHRMAYELRYGESPGDAYVCHHCDHPICCNPAHLFVGTQFDNMGDASVKGRMHRALGERAVCPRGHALTPENTWYWRSPTPLCLTCKRENGRKADRRRRVRARAARPPRQLLTHCRNGHMYTPENVYMYRGVRMCRTCRVEADPRRRH